MDDTLEPMNIVSEPDVTEEDLGEAVETDELYDSFTDEEFPGDEDISLEDDDLIDF